jgi:hypothetical protein
VAAGPKTKAAQAEAAGTSGRAVSATATKTAAAAAAAAAAVNSFTPGEGVPVAAAVTAPAGAAGDRKHSESSAVAREARKASDEGWRSRWLAHQEALVGRPRFCCVVACVDDSAYGAAAQRCRRLVGSAPFRRLVVLLVVAGCALVGVESYASLRPATNALTRALNVVLLGLMAAEVLLKLVADRSPWLQIAVLAAAGAAAPLLSQNWVLVGALGGVSVCALAAVAGAAGSLASVAEVEWLWTLFDSLVVLFSFPLFGGRQTFPLVSLRVLRLVRLSVPVLRRRRALRLVYVGLSEALCTAGACALVYAVALLGFGCAGVLAFREQDPARFGSLPAAALTLLRVGAFDDATEVVLHNKLGCHGGYHGLRGALDLYNATGSAGASAGGGAAAVADGAGFARFTGGAGMFASAFYAPVCPGTAGSAAAPVAPPLPWLAPVLVLPFTLLSGTLVFGLALGAAVAGMRTSSVMLQRRAEHEEGFWHTRRGATLVRDGGGLAAQADEPGLGLGLSTTQKLGIGASKHAKVHPLAASPFSRLGGSLENNVGGGGGADGGAISLIPNYAEGTLGDSSSFGGGTMGGTLGGTLGFANFGLDLTASAGGGTAAAAAVVAAAEAPAPPPPLKLLPQWGAWDGAGALVALLFTGSVACGAAAPTAMPGLFASGSASATYSNVPPWLLWATFGALLATVAEADAALCQLIEAKGQAVAARLRRGVAGNAWLALDALSVAVALPLAVYATMHGFGIGGSGKYGLDGAGWARAAAAAMLPRSLGRWPVRPLLGESAGLGTLARALGRKLLGGGRDGRAGGSSGGSGGGGGSSSSSSSSSSGGSILGGSGGGGGLRTRVAFLALGEVLSALRYILLYCALMVYLFSCAAVALFGANDPFRFGSLHDAALTLSLFVCGRGGPGWSVAMFTNMYGCANFGYERMPQLCVTSYGWGWVAAAYFVLFASLVVATTLALLCAAAVVATEQARERFVAAARIEVTLARVMRKGGVDAEAAVAAVAAVTPPVPGLAGKKRSKGVAANRPTAPAEQRVGWLRRMRVAFRRPLTQADALAYRRSFDVLDLDSAAANGHGPAVGAGGGGGGGGGGGSSSSDGDGDGDDLAVDGDAEGQPALDGDDDGETVERTVARKLRFRPGAFPGADPFAAVNRKGAQATSTASR